MSEDLNGGYEGIDGSELPKVVDIVSAYVSNNSLRAADLPSLIGTVHTALRQLGDAPAPVPDVPAVPVKKSITKDYIICLEDGKKFKSLRRHLSSSYNMTPGEYRAKWNLPSDYPMVAPSYSATRSQLARDSGLGQIAASQARAARMGSGKAQVEPQVEAVKPGASATAAGSDEGQAASRKGRGRSRKAA